MRKDISELPPEIQAQINSLADKPEDEINADDIPEVLHWSNAKRGVFYRPVKQQITLRLDADVVSWFKARQRSGRGYQTDINTALRDHVRRTEDEVTV